METNTEQTLTVGKVQKVLDWAYDKAVNGMPGMGTAQDLAADFMRGDRTLEKKVNSLIRWQNTKAATTGFVTGIGGLITLPVAIPADLASTIYIQIRMIAAIAIMYGYDVKDDRVKSLVYVCLVASSVKDAAAQFGIKIGEKLTMQAVKSISIKTIREINKRVGFKLLTKFGEKGLINLGKAVPFLGGFLNAGLDLFETAAIAKVAKNTFSSI